MPAPASWLRERLTRPRTLATGSDRGRAGDCLVCAVFLADTVHLAPQARWVWGCGSGAAGLWGIEVVLRLFLAAGRISEPPRGRAAARLSPPPSQPTVATTLMPIRPAMPTWAPDIPST